MTQGTDRRLVLQARDHDPTGTVRWVDLTEDYKVRTRPETALAVFDQLSQTR